MRHHPRRPLPVEAQRTLQRWQRKLDAAWAAEQLRPSGEARSAGALADAHWEIHRPTKTLAVVVEVLAAMASPSVKRCMYCEHDRGSQIDHAQPKSVAPQRTFDWDNYVWSCGKCNHDKLDRYHADMVVPTTDDPLAFLDLTAQGRWDARDDNERGRATLDTLPHLNGQELVTSRELGRRKVLRQLAALARNPSPTDGDIDSVRRVVVNDPFSDVFAAVLATLRLPGAREIFFDVPEVVDFVATHPEMDRWLAEADAERWLAAREEISALASRIRVHGEGDAEEA